MHPEQRVRALLAAVAASIFFIGSPAHAAAPLAKHDADFRLTQANMDAAPNDAGKLCAAPLSIADKQSEKR